MPKKDILRVIIAVLIFAAIIWVIFGDKLVLIHKNIYEIIVFEGDETPNRNPDVVCAYYMVCRPVRDEEGLRNQILLFLNKNEIIKKLEDEYPNRKIELRFYQPSDIFDIGVFPETRSDFTIWVGMFLASIDYVPNMTGSPDINIDTENLLNPIR